MAFFFELRIISDDADWKRFLCADHLSPSRATGVRFPYNGEMFLIWVDGVIFAG